MKFTCTSGGGVVEVSPGVVVPSCPEASAAWIEDTSVFDLMISQEDLSQLLETITLLLVIALSIRLILAVFRGKKG